MGCVSVYVQCSGGRCSEGGCDESQALVFKCVKDFEIGFGGVFKDV